MIASLASLGPMKDFLSFLGLLSLLGSQLMHKTNMCSSAQEHISILVGVGVGPAVRPGVKGSAECGAHCWRLSLVLSCAVTRKNVPEKTLHGKEKGQESPPQNPL